jgi:hypothetical protein
MSAALATLLTQLLRAFLRAFGETFLAARRDSAAAQAQRDLGAAGAALPATQILTEIADERARLAADAAPDSDALARRLQLRARARRADRSGAGGQ